MKRRFSKRRNRWSLCSRTTADSISDKDIEWISAHRAELRISGNDWLYSDDGGDAYSLIQQYMDGQIDASRLMKEIDRKVRMRIMEGA